MSRVLQPLVPGLEIKPLIAELRDRMEEELDYLRTERPEAFAGEYEPLDPGPDRVGFVRGGAIRVVVPLRPGDRVDGGDRDLLPEYDQELSVL